MITVGDVVVDSRNCYRLRQKPVLFAKDERRFIESTAIQVGTTQCNGDGAFRPAIEQNRKHCLAAGFSGDQAGMRLHLYSAELRFEFKSAAAIAERKHSCY